MLKINLKQLEAFTVTAEFSSFTKAAEQLGYSQSTVSFQIKQLEDELGCLLFERIKHTVTPVLGERAAHNSDVLYSIDFHVNPHQLRHTYITNLLLAGVDVKTVQALAGHEHARITLDIYAHLTYNQPKDLISKVSKAFGDAPI